MEVVWLLKFSSFGLFSKSVWCSERRYVLFDPSIKRFIPQRELKAVEDFELRLPFDLEILMKVDI